MGRDFSSSTSLQGRPRLQSFAETLEGSVINMGDRDRRGWKEGGFRAECLKGRDSKLALLKPGGSGIMF